MVKGIQFLLISNLVFKENLYISVVMTHSKVNENCKWVYVYTADICPYSRTHCSKKGYFKKESKKFLCKYC